MRIAVDISQAVYEGTGVGRFTTGFVESICSALAHNSDIQWVFFYVSFRRDLPEKLRATIHASEIPLKKLPIPPTAAEYIWNNLHVMPVSLLIPDCDWIITSDWTEPPSRTQKATIIHDLVFCRYPDTVDETILQTMHRKLPLVSHESDLIFTDSHATKDDLVHYYPDTHASIVVNYPGVSIQSVSEHVCNDVSAKYDLPSSFLLTVGKREPRKNLARLIAAFTKASLDDTELIVVGSEGWGLEANEERNVRYLGFVEDSELAALYQRAKGFVLASIWEGFGYPILEAMQLGTPVATSNCSSMKEIAGGHAHLFDPMDDDAIAAALQNLTSDNSFITSQTKAQDHARSFTWQRYLTTVTDSLIHQ